MRAIYFYDATNHKFKDVGFIEDGSVIPPNSTEIVPTSEDGCGLYDPKWDGTKWVGLTPEEYAEAHKNDPQPDVPTLEPTSEQQSITGLAQLIADQAEHITSLEQAITLLAQGGN